MDEDDAILRDDAEYACEFWGIAAPPGASYEHLCALIHGVATGKIEPLTEATLIAGNA